jgi:hypothetical protein
MKKALFLLLTLFISLTARHAAAQQSHGLVYIPVGALRAAYRASFGHNPDFHKYAQLAIAINRCKSQYFPDAAGGFWNGQVQVNNADRSQDTFTIVTISKGPFPRNPQGIAIGALKEIFAGGIGRPPDLAFYPDLALSIDSYQTKAIHCSGGFWDGEQTVENGTPAYQLVWTTSINSPQAIPAAQLAASFAARSNRAPDFAGYADMARAVTFWIEDHEKGRALGGFWNGQQTNSGAGTTYGIVLVR